MERMANEILTKTTEVVQRASGDVVSTGALDMVIVPLGVFVIVACALAVFAIASRRSNN